MTDASPARTTVVEGGWMSDRMAVVVALAAASGALLERGPSPWVGVALAVLALAVHRPAALALAVLLLTGALAARAEAGLVGVVPGPFTGTVTLLGDPEPALGGGVSVDVRLDGGRHLEATARAPAAVAALALRAAGQRVRVTGRLERPPPGSDWLRRRHLAGRIAVDAVTAWSPGGIAARAANGVRATLERGAAALPERQRPLFLGFVLGDTRGQPVDVADDFRGAGLSHLLAVSGENVAFVLALAGPLLRRLTLRPRLVATLAVIGFFALVTRFEPSVLRASAMAALAVTASTLGREASRLRLLALAVTGLLIADPFLVRTTGFQLSVGASAGIVVLASRLSARLPGPRWLVAPLAVTIAAQAGVAPLLATAFGGVPLATVPANLLAAPAAGAVMVWGLGAGLVAGIAGARAAAVLHWPTGVLVGWIGAVAHWGATAPLGELGLRGLVVIAAGAAVLATPAPRLVRTAAGLAVAGAVAVPPVALALSGAPDGAVALGPGARLWRGGGGAVVVLDGRTRLDDVLQGLRQAGQRRIDVVVLRTAGAARADTVSALRRWGEIGRVLVPLHGVDGTTAVSAPLELRAGTLEVRVTPESGRLTVEVGRGPPV